MLAWCPAAKSDLAGGATDELRHPGAGVLVGLGGSQREPICAAMYVGVAGPEELVHGLYYSGRLLRRGRRVEEDEAVPVARLRQEREVGTPGGQIGHAGAATPLRNVSYP
jgi:hypothetical protein